MDVDDCCGQGAFYFNKYISDLESYFIQVKIYEIYKTIKQDYML